MLCNRRFPLTSQPSNSSERISAAEVRRRKGSRKKEEDGEGKYIIEKEKLKKTKKNKKNIKKIDKKIKTIEAEGEK